MNTKLKDYQVQAASESLELLQAQRSHLVLGKTGSGKTFLISHNARLLKDGYVVDELDFLDAPPRTLVLTPKPVVTQFQRVAARHFKAFPDPVDVMAYSGLRTKAGRERYITWVTDTVPNLDGGFAINPTWDIETFPDVLVLDECQLVKNHETQLAALVKAYIQRSVELGKGCVVWTSATPFAILAQTKIFCMSVLSWNELDHRRNMESIVGPYVNIDKASKEGSARFAEYLRNKGVLIEIKGVKFAKRALTHNKLLILRPAQKIVYEKAFEEWLKIRAEREMGVYGSSFAEEMAAMTKFRQVAEMLRTSDLAQWAVDTAKKGKQVILGLAYRTSFDVVMGEMEQLGISRSAISVIHGSQNDRQANIDRFQRGETTYLIMTQASGKVGLSLDNDGEHPGQLPREVGLSVVWSPIDMVQILGRAHRANTISTTHQIIFWFKDTIEESVAAVASKGVSALSKLGTDNLDWVRIYAKQQKVSVVELAQEGQEVDLSELELEDEEEAA